MFAFLGRRCSMEDNFFNNVSVEKFAAFLDGNLLPDEMQQMSSMVESNEMMHDIYAASKLTDETLTNYTDDDLTLPEEMTSAKFELPHVFRDFQSSELSEDFEVAACADVADEFEIDNEVSSNDVDSLDDLPSFEDSANPLQDEINMSSPEDDGGILSDPNEF